MNLEKTKTVVLLMLVVSSLILTFFLWYGSFSDYEETPVVFQEAFFFEEPREDLMTLKPEEIVITAPDNEFIVFRRGSDIFEEIWQKTIYVIKEAEIAETADHSLMDDNAVMTIIFDPALPLEMLVNVAERPSFEATKAELFRGDKTISVYFTGEKNGLLIKFNGESTAEGLANLLDEVFNKEYTKYYLLTDKKIPEDDADSGGETSLSDDVPEISGFYYTVAREIYLPVENYRVRPYLTFDKEEIATEDLLKAVFVDKNLARRLEEPDGTLIFTDGETGLRISEFIEYTAPRLEKGTATHSYRNALQKANEYICFYGGWPRELYLGEIFINNGSEKNDYSYYAKWLHYYEGMPVLGAPGVTELRFKDQGLYYYKRSLAYPLKEQEEKVIAVSGEDALSRAFEIYTESISNGTGGVLPQLRDIYPAYIINLNTEEDSLIANPVWIVQIEEEVFLIDAKDLSEVFPGEIDEYF